MANLPFQTLLVDENLRETFKELQAFLGVQFDQHEIEQVFIDAGNDQCSFKWYNFYQAQSFFFDAWTITGAVDEYEPDTIYLKSSGGIGKRRKFEAFFASRHDS